MKGQNLNQQQHRHKVEKHNQHETQEDYVVRLRSPENIISHGAALKGQLVRLEAIQTNQHKTLSRLCSGAPEYVSGDPNSGVFLVAHLKKDTLLC